MRPEFRAQIEELCGQKVYDWQAKIIDAIMAEYEFKCPSFVYAGPGHQSRHDCENLRPHPIEGYHSDSLYEWVGTAYFEVLIDEDCAGCGGTGKRQGFGVSGKEITCYVCEGCGKRRKLHNAPHEGYNCEMCRISSAARREADEVHRQ